MVSFIPNFSQEHFFKHPNPRAKTPNFSWHSLSVTIRPPKTLPGNPSSKKCIVTHREIICNEMVVDFVSEHFLCWLGNMRDYETFQLSSRIQQAQGLMGPLPFPSLSVLFYPYNQEMKVVKSINQFPSVSELIEELFTIVEQNDEMLFEAKAVQ
jgi:hypothetical protein